MAITLSSTLQDILDNFVVTDADHPLEEATISQPIPAEILLFWEDTSRVRLDVSVMSITSGGVAMAPPPIQNIPGGENPSNPDSGPEVPTIPATLTGLNPSTIPAGGGGFTLTLTGSGFTVNSQVQFGAAVGNLEFSSDTQGNFPVGPEGYAAPGTVQVSVDGSNQLPFDIT